ncbi:MAG: sulfite exporter TauE/SafE family protein, partial [Planctomycetes bacterium]|nr:sulfite exporter TauE/SafE family protein [Planctomycetota bacterium]
MPPEDPALFDLIVVGLAALAGFIGALVGLGGGAILVPGLVLLLGVPMKTAVATSLVAVVFTSSAAAMIRGRDALTNYRVGVLLEVVAGAASVVGAVTAFLIEPRLLQLIFGGTLLAIAGLSARRLEDRDSSVMPSHPWAAGLALDGVEDRPEGARIYRVQRVPAGLSIMGVAGVIAGMMGLGAGAVKVLSMDVCM